jgi:transcriptional regulator with XRE-family HTH domain
MNKAEKHSKESLAAIGKMIKIARISKEMTQDQLSKKSGISIPIISAIESGECNFTIKTLFSICNSLNLYLDLSVKIKE